LRDFSAFDEWERGSERKKKNVGKEKIGQQLIKFYREVMGKNGQ